MMPFDSGSGLSLCLQENVIDIWLCQANELQSKAGDFYAALSIEEKNRADRFKFAAHKNRFILFHGFMREVLAKYLTISPEYIQYTKGEKGKPYLFLKDDDKQRALQFNLSHTRDIALLAVTKKAELGVDIEYIDRKTDWQGIAKRFFTSSEQTSLFALSVQQQQPAFYELWTRKEAYMKVLGCGLSLSPTQFSLTVPPEVPALIEHHGEKYYPHVAIKFQNIILPKTLKKFRAALAIASNISIQTINCYQFSNSA